MCRKGRFSQPNDPPRSGKARYYFLPSVSPLVRPPKREARSDSGTVAAGRRWSDGRRAGRRIHDEDDRPTAVLPLRGPVWGGSRESSSSREKLSRLSDLLARPRPSEATETLEVSSFSVLCSNPCNRSSPSPPPSWLPLPPPPPPPPSSLVPPRALVDIMWRALPLRLLVQTDNVSCRQGFENCLLSSNTVALHL